MEIFCYVLLDFALYLIYTFIFFFIFKHYTKHKCNIFSKIAEKEIEDYWGSITDDSSITDINTDDSQDKFVDSIRIIDDDSTDTVPPTMPRFF